MTFGWLTSWRMASSPRRSKSRLSNARSIFSGRGTPSKPESQPIVHLERKNIRRGADLQDENIFSRAMNRPIGNEQQLVSTSRHGVNKFLHVYLGRVAIALLQLSAEFVGINVLSEPKIDFRPRFAVDKVVRLVLCE